MRIVLGANILISVGLKRQSMPGMAVLVIERRGVLLKSHVTEQQLFEVVARRYFASLIGADARTWLKKLLAAAEPVTNHRALRGLSRSYRRQICGVGGQRPWRLDRHRRR